MASLSWSDLSGQFLSTLSTCSEHCIRLSVQESIRSWVVARSHEPAEKARTHEDRARCAAMLRVLWPRAVHKRRRPGRPTRNGTHMTSSH